jgi:hypothetical protein
LLIVVYGFELGWWDLSEDFEQVSVVEPVDRFQCRPLPPPLTEKLPYSCGRGDTPQPKTGGQSDDGGMPEFLAQEIFQESSK